MVATTDYLVIGFSGDPDLNKLVFRDVAAKVCTGSALAIGECDHLGAPLFHLNRYRQTNTSTEMYAWKAGSQVEITNTEHLRMRLRSNFR